MKDFGKILLVLGTGLLIYGLATGGAAFVWARAVSLCLSCMGLE